MIKRVWWAVKVRLFPSLQNRKLHIRPCIERRNVKPTIKQAESHLRGAIVDITDAMERREKC